MYTVALECVPSECADAASVLIALGEIDIASEEHVRGRARLDDGARLAQKLDRWDLVGDAILAGGRFGFSPSRPDARERAALVQEVLAHLPETDVRRVVALSCWLADLMVNVDARRDRGCGSIGPRSSFPEARTATASSPTQSPTPGSANSKRRPRIRLRASARAAGVVHRRGGRR